MRSAVGDNRGVTDTSAAPRRPWIFAIWLVVAGVIGLWAAFALTMDKFLLLENPAADLDCNLSVLVQCGVNLDSWQGELFGFPNPILGLFGWTATLVVGMSVLAGARFPRWYWIVFNLGVLGALALVIFLIYSSIYVLGTLCPWCMLTWSVTIPTFWYVTARNATEGVFGERVRGAGRFALSWLIPIVLVSYAVVALLAQLRLDWLRELFLVIG